MKLRLHNNSIRLRLRRGEIARFGETGRVEGAFELGEALGQRVVYALVRDDAAACVGVQVAGNRITVSMPPSLVTELVATDRIAVSGEQATGHGNTVTILVEKEFQRAHAREPDPDLYPNPAYAAVP